MSRPGGQADAAGWHPQTGLRVGGLGRARCAGRGKIALSFELAAAEHNLLRMVRLEGGS